MIQDKIALARSFNNIASNYDEITNTFHHKICDYIIENNLILNLTNKNCKILDSGGGGTGKWAILLAKKGFYITLCDISIKELEIAKKKIDDLGLKIKIV